MHLKNDSYCIRGPDEQFTAMIMTNYPMSEVVNPQVPPDAHKLTPPVIEYSIVISNYPLFILTYSGQLVYPIRISSYMMRYIKCNEERLW